MLANPVPNSEQLRALPADAESFRVFYGEALPIVYGYLLHRCGGSAEIAEDITQETFLSAVAELRKGRQVERPVAWIVGIARHKLIDYYRRRERAERLFATDEAEPVDLTAEGGEAVRERTIAALAQVPSAQRAALVLRHLDGFTVPEVARALGRSVEAVESLLVRGRVSFKRAYLEVNG
jgi:RNA polymerase sigma-70 factor (ECF subfamily)